MAVSEKVGVFTYVDANGNKTLLYPAVKTDETLSESGTPADAAAVGEELANTVKLDQIFGQRFDGNLNTLTDVGNYWIELSACTNAPPSSGYGYGYLEVIKGWSDTTDVMQRFTEHNSGKTYVRTSVNGWSNWKGYSCTLSDFGITATAAELNYVDGVTSNIQTQLNNKINVNPSNISLLNNRVSLRVDDEGGNIQLISPNAVRHAEMDLYNDNGFRIFLWNRNTNQLTNQFYMDDHLAYVNDNRILTVANLANNGNVTTPGEYAADAAYVASLANSINTLQNHSATEVIETNECYAYLSRLSGNLVSFNLLKFPHIGPQDTITVGNSVLLATKYANATIYIQAVDRSLDCDLYVRNGQITIKNPRNTNEALSESDGRPGSAEPYGGSCMIFYW